MMKIPKWICIKCEQTFTRKWNAFRHCNNKHGAIFESVIHFREYLMNRPNSQSSLIPNNALNFNQLPYQQNRNFQDKRINPHTDTLSKPIDGYTSDEKLLYNTMNELAPMYEELENLLSNMPEPNRLGILGGIVSQAIYSDNPVVFMNTQLKTWRNATVCNRMINNSSVFLGFNKQFTKDYLKMGIKKR